MDQKSGQNFIIGIILLLIVLWTFLARKNDSGCRKKYSKKDLADFFGITKPTLGKWIKYFQNEFTEAQWQVMRSMSPEQYSILISSFGLDQEMVLSKKMITLKAESSYKVVADNVKRNLNKLGITEDAWNNCNVFPPITSQSIVNMLG